MIPGKTVTMTERMTERMTSSPVPTVTIPATDSPELSLVMVTYHTGGIVLDALAAIAATVERPYEVLVVDNPAATALATRTLLRLRSRGVRLFEPDENLGFGAANHAAIRNCRAATICLINPDALPQPGWVEPLLTALADPTIAIAAPLFLEPDGSIQEAGMRIDSGGVTAPLRTMPGAPVIDVLYSSAACWMMQRSVYERLGGFDPAYYPAYYEDADLALTAWHAGLRRVVCRDSRVVHHSGQSTPGPALQAVSQHGHFMDKWASTLESAEFTLSGR